MTPRDLAFQAPYMLTFSIKVGIIAAVRCLLFKCVLCEFMQLLTRVFCLQGGRTLNIGDCALFQGRNALPYIGILRKVTLETVDKKEEAKLTVNWLYRLADLELGKGVPLEAAPNEIFYSFHKDDISAASLLHPCKVAFLRKGVELPEGVSSFVCRRVYDTASKCLWWLTDRDYTNVSFRLHRYSSAILRKWVAACYLLFKVAYFV